MASTAKTSTSHTNNTPQQTSRLLNLPAEIRNSIYEFVLADVQDNVCIDLEGGDNKIYKVNGKNRSAPNGDKTSRLSLLLTCRQINTEASGIAYSKMSMSLDTVFPNPRDFPTRGTAALTVGGERMSLIMANFVKVFIGPNLACIPDMVFPRTEVLLHLLTFNSPTMDDQRHTDFCTAKCASLSYWQGLVHSIFHNVKRITVDGEDRKLGSLYKDLTKGASWLSITMEPYEVRCVLQVFSNLEEIVVRRNCGEQVSKVIGGKVYAAESGMEMLGTDDWLYDIKKRQT